ncbi:2'-5' RNA ligase [Wenyingzhuangia heitensis]|uniref:2'-5' RNA ligase n=1 Tax=Wenyingzhuangia heitensis TaxID=1487859 RepID=A0ABX0UG29_9FLAO|nr:mutarotase [Wenyingzhuangia heitensis]NIJ46491.1 2'-5' RNA ligase [Wenyingzhuangia heitensis]
MDLKKHYDSLYKESVLKIAKENCQIDPLIDAGNDNRFGITLLLRPSEEVKNHIQYFLRQLKLIEPSQYYYENSDIHITVMSIISCYNGFDLDKLNIEDYNQIICKSLIDFTPLKITCRGVTASSSCLMIKGFMENESINLLRDRLRAHFRATTLEQSIDKRYAIQTAHSTVVRFRKKLSNKNEFLALVEKFKDYDFGTFKVERLELVYNDWYQRKKSVRKLTDFTL